MQPQAKRVVRSTVSETATRGQLRNNVDDRRAHQVPPKVAILRYEAQQHALEVERRERIHAALQVDAMLDRVSAPEPCQFCAEPETDTDTDAPLPVMVFCVAVGLVAWGIFGWAGASLFDAVRGAL